MKANLPATPDRDGRLVPASTRDQTMEPIWRMVRERLEETSRTSLDAFIDAVLSADPAPDLVSIRDGLVAVAQAKQQETEPWERLLTDPDALDHMALTLRAMALVERSSLGSTAPQLLRDRVDNATIAETLARVRRPARVSASSPTHDRGGAAPWQRPGDTVARPRTDISEQQQVDALIQDAKAHASAQAGTFWSSLTPEEREAIASTASASLFPQGTVLWEEGDLADHLVVIVSGYVRVSVVRDGRERTIALRGPGDIIGERAALLLRQHTATITALDDVNTLRLPTSTFAAFLSHHPRVMAVLERELYERMTRGDVPADVASPADMMWTEPHIPHALAGAKSGGTGQPSAAPAWTGQMCSIVFVDIAGFSGAHRNDDDRRAIRRVMYDLLHDAFTHSQVPWNACHREDRGDGALIVVPPEVPTRQVVDPMLTRLAAGLRRHNRHSYPAVRIKLRIALHVGPITNNNEGVNEGIAGSAVIHTARLLDAPVLKRQLATTQSELGVITSTFVYDNVIADAPGSLAPSTYQRVTCRVKESRLTGWMHLSSATGPAA